MRNSGKLHLVGGRRQTDTKIKLEDELDAVFMLPLTEFITARNALATQLKKAGRGDDANRVKALVKPSISAWTVNQLYWKHREAFDLLIESGARFHKAQSSGSAGKLTDMRTALDLRRQALTQLSDLATSLLRDAGHNPTLETIRRITTTLEAMSAYASRSDAPRPGRLTLDIDPPGFESFASFVPGAGTTELKEKPARVPPSQKTQKSGSVATNMRRQVTPDTRAPQLEATLKARIAAAKVGLQEAKRSLTEVRVRAHSLDAAQKKAFAVTKIAEKQRRQAEERLEKARAASDDAAQRVRSIAVEVEEAAREVAEAERTVKKASKELEKLF